MGKVRVSSGRGTGTREIDDASKKWAGDDYKKIQEEKKKQAGNRTVISGRGTGSRKYSDIPSPKERPSTEGMTRVTGRGTGSRKGSK